MSSLSARFTQTPTENKRYLLDYTLFLSAGETIVSVTPQVIPLGQPPLGSPPLVVSNLTVGPGGLQAIYFVSGGVDGQAYEVQFAATTSIGQILDDVAEYDIAVKT